MRPIAAALLAAACVTASADTQPAPSTADDALLTALTGRWAGTGTILGQPARAEMEWVPVLSGRFMRLTWVSHIGQAPKTQRFEGIAYYQATATGYRATWFDSSGMARPIEAERRDGAIIATWGTLETELGETTYRPDGHDAVEVVDRVRGKNGEWREFGRTTLRRVP